VIINIGSNKTDGVYDCGLNQSLGRVCEIQIYYLENGERKNADVTMSSNDNGFFQCSSYNYRECEGGELIDPSGTRRGNPITGFTRPGGIDGKPTADFTFVPSAYQVVTVTVTVNGVTETIRVNHQTI